MDFRILGINGKKKFYLTEGFFYKIPKKPAEKEAYGLYAHCRNGKLCFGISRDGIKSKRFINIPDFLSGRKPVTHISFPDYKFTHAGHHYGQPTFHSILMH